MELFIEFVLTISLSLLFSFIIAKLLSTTDKQSVLRSFKSNVIDKVGTEETKFEAKLKKNDFESEGELGFVDRHVDVDELDESTKENAISLQGFFIEALSEGSREVEIVDLVENSVGFGACDECEEKLLEQSSERGNFNEIEMASVRDEVGLAKSKILVAKCGEEGSLFDDDDDWEGIERSELGKVFGTAVLFVGSVSNADKITSLGSDLKMLLYALHKVATEGPCHEPQPMLLKVSARAKWNAWQRLGNMSPEEAMEQYINLLSRSIPGWAQDDYTGDKQVFADAEALRKLEFACNTVLPNQPGATDERNLDELKHIVEGFDVTESQVHF
ncbi:ACBP domain-containing protein [Cephalotus follicularis]|uniref:ACBP domain-containing protein n=1 Tax=Cephalotus follicularis TaxID=3775 RepID=A0A1Q3ASM0_CEPFO|nr:ACBP domain-containing protein [Cephalotus follicularis]